MNRIVPVPTREKEPEVPVWSRDGAWYVAEPSPYRTSGAKSARIRLSSQIMMNSTYHLLNRKVQRRQTDSAPNKW
jgi:hypothetical protein